MFSVNYFVVLLFGLSMKVLLKETECLHEGGTICSQKQKERSNEERETCL